MAKIIEAKAIISGKETLSPLVDALSKKLDQLGKNKGMSQQVDNMAKSLKGVQSQMAAIDKFQASKTGFRSAADNFSKTQAAVQAAAKAMQAGEGPAKRLAADYQRAQTAASNAARAFEAQRSSFASSRRALEQMGIPAAKAASAQDRLRASIEKTTAAMAKQERGPGRGRQIASGVASTVGTLGGLAAGAGAKRFARSAIASAAEFDIGTRKQREFTDITKEDQGPLTKQALRIGQETPFTNLDVVKAQTAAMQGLPSNFNSKLKSEVAAGILENVKNYAMVMEADLEQSSEAIRSYLQATGKDISTKTKALAESNKATNQLVKMAKLGGMSADDVQAYMKYALPTATAAGISPEAAMSIGLLARRGGLRGDEAGVFMRATASKIAAPTKKGRTALSAAGIDYDSFVRMPESLSVDRLQGHFRNEMGTSFTPDVQKRLAEALADKSIIGDRGRFTESVTDIIGSQFPKNKKGVVSAMTRKTIANAAGGFHKMSAGGIDAEGLLDKVMSSDMTLAQLNAFLTDKHGGKGAITQRQREEYVAVRQQLKNVGDDPDYAKRKADEIMGGLGGALNNLKGSLETLTQTVGTANEAWLKTSFDKLGKAVDWFSNLPQPVQQGASVAAGGLALGAAGYSMVKLFGGFGLSASAVALDGAAAALTGAAITLKGGAAAGIATNAAGGAVAAGSAGATAGAAATWGSRLLGAVPYLGGIGVAAGVGAGLYYMHKDASQFEGMTSGERGAKARGGSIGDARRRAWNEDRERMGIPALGTSAPAWPAEVNSGSAANAPAKAELTGSAEVKGEASLKVEVTASSVLLQIIEQAKGLAMNLTGQLNANGPGSVGKSSPDASAPAAVGPAR